jgi:hypothetical protein
MACRAPLRVKRLGNFDRPIGSVVGRRRIAERESERTLREIARFMPAERAAKSRTGKKRDAPPGVGRRAGNALTGGDSPLSGFR